MAAEKKEVDTLSLLPLKPRLIGLVSQKSQSRRQKRDLFDTEAALPADKGFLTDLEKTCDTKNAEWEEIVKLRPMSCQATILCISSLRCNKLCPEDIIV